MMRSEPRYYLCTGACVRYEELHLHPESHVVGTLAYLTDDGHKVSALARWDVSVAASTVPPLHPLVDVYLVGDSRLTRCRFPGCDNKFRWEIGKAAFDVLMARYPRRKDG